MFNPLVTSSWLNNNINQSDLVIVDASGTSNKAGIKQELENRIIPKSRYFDLKNDFCAPGGSFPNTFPSADQFEQGCRRLGINDSSIIIVYDNIGIYFSPRVWWMFKTMGHEKVFVLNGGLPDWIESGFETNDQYETSKKEGNFKVNLDQNQVKHFDFIRFNINEQSNLVIDARSNDRFHSKVPEPRKGLRSGNIPFSINIPYSEVLDGSKFKSTEELSTLFKNAGVDNRPITFSCGSGITACILLLAAELALDNDTSIFDGSWTEYASLTDDIT